MSSTTLSASPISKVDYDVLREIFVHCLPEYPLSRTSRSVDQQPNVKVAPLLLCQVCSSWRTVALVSARLWSHLSYFLTVCVSKEGNKRKFKYLAREVEFLQWWRKNQGSIPPFLRLSVKRSPRRISISELAQDGIDFILAYVASAQYLELSAFFWERIRERNEAGYLFVPSKLHTLMRVGWGLRSDGMGVGHSFLQAQMLFRPCNLRRISIDEYRLRIETNIIPTFWSTLTHISVSDIEISLSYWFILLGGLPKLEWAHFDIEEPREHKQCDSHNNITLSHLSSFYIAMRDSEKYSEHVPFSALFTNVHLPAVRTLSLSWGISQPGHKCYIAGELSTILKSTPAVTTLVLDRKFLAMAHAAFASPDLYVGGDVEPIWKHAAHLAELQLEMPCHSEEIDPLVWSMLFTKGRWVDLQSMTCPIRLVTIADYALGFFVSENDDEAFTAKSPIIQKYAEKAPGITFRFTSQSGSKTVEEISKEWDSSM